MLQGVCNCNIDRMDTPCPDHRLSCPFSCCTVRSVAQPDSSVCGQILCMYVHTWRRRQKSLTNSVQLNNSPRLDTQTGMRIMMEPVNRCKLEVGVLLRHLCIDCSGLTHWTAMKNGQQYLMQSVLEQTCRALTATYVGCLSSLVFPVIHLDVILHVGEKMEAYEQVIITTT